MNESDKATQDTAAAQPQDASVPTQVVDPVQPEPNPEDQGGQEVPTVFATPVDQLGVVPQESDNSERPEDGEQDVSQDPSAES